MSAFTGELTITSLDDDCLMWRTESWLRYEVGFLGSGVVVDIPPGTISDGLTRPWLLRLAIRAWARHSRAVLVHDVLYAGLRAGAPHAAVPTRRAADQVFLEAMRVSGVPAWQRLAFYAAVRLFGAPYAASDLSGSAAQ